MRLLISGSKSNEHTLGTFIFKNLPRGWELEMISFHDKFNELLRSKINRIIFRLFPRVIISKMDQLFIDQVRAFKPTIIVIFKGMEISKRSLIQIKSFGVKLVNYNLDHPFVYESRGSGNRFVREAIPYYDLHITYSSLIEKQLQYNFNVATALLPFGYDLSDKAFEQLNLNQSEEMRVCFIGNPDKSRVELITFLTGNNVKVDVYGFRWDRFLKNGNCLRLFDQVNDFDYWKTIARYRVQLNILRTQNKDAHNMRSFEVPAAGGIMLAPDTPGHREYFENEKEIFLFGSDAECLEKCRYILSLGQEQALKVRLAARERSVKSGYSYKNRTRQLINIIESVS